MRTLSHLERERLMSVVRRMLRNDVPRPGNATAGDDGQKAGGEEGADAARARREEQRAVLDAWHCPFRFHADENARIISGEEEAIYGWTAINYLMGTLYEDSRGFGTVSNPSRTYGALDMGGASTQISFFQPDGDVVANLFKMQLGAAKHWNVYAHSFLYYGANEARERLGAKLAVWLPPPCAPPRQCETSPPPSPSCLCTTSQSVPRVLECTAAPPTTT